MYEVQNIKKKIAGEIRSRRAYLNLTQRELAELADCSHVTVIHAEKADASLEMLCHIANTLSDYEDKGE